MMRRFLKLLLGNSVFANLLLAFIMIAGAIAAFSMIREIFPRFSLDLVTVTVPFPGADPEEVEEGICLKLEEALEGIEDVRKVSTRAQEGAGSAIVECDDNADIKEVKDQVNNRVDAITSFPRDAEKPIVQELKFRGDVLKLSIWGDLPEYQLKEVARQIQDELMALPEISQVEVNGIRDYEIAIEISEEKLRRYGLTFRDISRKVADNALNLHGGTLRTRDEEIRIRTIGRKYTAAEYERIPVITRADGTTIRLGQLAQIRDSFNEDVAITAFFNGKPAVSVDVLKTEDEDAIKISEAVDRYLKKKRRELPGTVHITKWLDSSRMVADRLSMLINNGKIGLCLVFLILWLFLDIRLSFWVTMGIPISLAGGLAIMAACGETLNMLTLFGLIMILGLIVDDAIVVGEAIYVYRRKGESPFNAAIAGTGEVAWPVIAAVTTTIVAFLPLFFVSGIMGKFIRRIPIPVIAALSVSLVEALFILPVHLRHLPDLTVETKSKMVQWMRRFRENFAGRLERFVEHNYGPAMDRILNWRYVSLAISIAVLIITIGLVKGGIIKFVFFPESNDDFMRARIELSPGTPTHVSKDVAARVLAGWREVEEHYREKLKGKDLTVGIYSLVGGSIDERIVGTGNNFLELTLELLPSEERGTHHRELAQLWQEKVGPIPEALSAEFGGFRHGPGGKPIDIMFLAKDQDTLINAGRDLMSRLGELKGVYNIQMDYQPGKREFQVSLKPEAYHLGLTIADIARHVNQGFYGDEVIRIQRGRDDVKVKVRYPEKDGRNSVNAFEKLRIRTPGGSEVPLLSVADIAVKEGQNTIRRQQKMRTLSVSADVNRRFNNADIIIKDLLANYIPELQDKHIGLYCATEGQAGEKAESVASLKIGFILAMLGIYLIIATIFRSYSQPLIIMVTIPFGIIGAVFGHIIVGSIGGFINLFFTDFSPHNGPMAVTMMSFFGMVALAGIVVNDAIVLIEAVNNRLGEGVPLNIALREGGKRRFRAIFLTTLTTFAGLTPIIIERSMQAQFLVPMAVSIAFGVAFATLLTLILLPCLFLIVNDLRCLSYYCWYNRWPEREAMEPRSLLRQQAIAAKGGPSGSHLRP